MSHDIMRYVGLAEEMHQMLWSEQEKFPVGSCVEHLVFSRWRCFFRGVCNLQEAEPCWRKYVTGVGLEALQPGVTSFLLSMYGF